MQHIAGKIGQVGYAFNYRLGEKGYALAIVKIAVSAIALKVVFVIQKEKGNAVVIELKKPAVLVSPTQLNVKAGDKGHLFLILFIYRAELRHDDPYLAAVFFEGCGQ